MENMAYTFELLLLKALEDNPENWALAMERAKHRVLKVRSRQTQTDERTDGHTHTLVFVCEPSYL